MWIAFARSFDPRFPLMDWKLMTTGYYFLIQYCPDLARDEAANVGVVLFCPELHFLKARTARSNDRIRQFFRPARPDWTRINVVKQFVERRLTIDRDQFHDLASLERFAATLANAVRMTKPRAIAVSDPEMELNRLFEELVGDRVRWRSARIRRILDCSFRAADVAPYIQRNLTVALPGFERTVRVPYAFQNGRLNLIQVACFRDLTAGAIIQKAGRYAFEGDLLYRHRDSTLGDLQLIVVGQFASEQKDIAVAVAEILEDARTELYTTKEIDRLLDVIRTTGKPVAGESVK
jgi:hypothetical protein